MSSFVNSLTKKMSHVQLDSSETGIYTKIEGHPKDVKLIVIGSSTVKRMTKLDSTSFMYQCQVVPIAYGILSMSRQKISTVDSNIIELMLNFWGLGIPQNTPVLIILGYGKVGQFSEKDLWLNLWSIFSQITVNASPVDSPLVTFTELPFLPKDEDRNNDLHVYRHNEIIRAFSGLVAGTNSYRLWDHTTMTTGILRNRIRVSNFKRFVNLNAFDIKDRFHIHSDVMMTISDQVRKFVINGELKMKDNGKVQTIGSEGTLVDLPHVITDRSIADILNDLRTEKDGMRRMETVSIPTYPFDKLTTAMIEVDIPVAVNDMKLQRRAVVGPKKWKKKMDPLRGVRGGNTSGRSGKHLPDSRGRSHPAGGYFSNGQEGNCANNHDIHRGRSHGGGRFSINIQSDNTTINNF